MKQKLPLNHIDKRLRLINQKIYDAKVAVMGFTYKKNITDYGEPPSVEIIEELVNLGVKVWEYCKVLIRDEDHTD